MRWTTGRRSENVVDARGRGFPMAAGGGVGMVIFALLAYMLTGRVPDQTQSPGQAAEQPGQAAAQDPMADFVSVVLGDTEDTWTALLCERFGRTYEEPQLVLFSQIVPSACGLAQAVMGPFYCPRDHRVYIDLSFYRELKERFGAPGDFAQAYVIAHEVGHHVQTLLGISDRVRTLQERSSETGANGLSVRMELQADCLAGVWGNHSAKMHDRLEPGDLEEGLRAASAIGDDTLQRRARGRVVPETFTHGSSAQRVQWFRRGFERGRIEDCDTSGE